LHSLHDNPDANELHSPDINESYSSNIIESYSSNIIESSSPDDVGKIDLPDNMDKIDSSDESGKFDLSGNRGVCKTPLRSPSQTIGAIVRGYKSSVTKQLNELGFVGKLWQRNYYEHIIRNEQSYQRISEYIINNPAKWTDDKFFR
jgi:putative transposase